MKKYVLLTLIFVFVFIAAYISLCYLVPGLRIKLAADSATYFIESIRFMVLPKIIISFTTGVIAEIIFGLVKKRL